MDLREYLFRNRLSVKEFSEKLECARTHLSQIVHKKRKPGKRLAKDIERLTNGEISAESLLNDSNE